MRQGSSESVWKGVVLALASVGSAFFLSSPLVAAPDMELGRYLANQCLTCHRNPATGGAIPNILGMAEQRLNTLIKAYRDKHLPNPVMQTATSGLTDQDIEALAAYFARTTRP